MTTYRRLDDSYFEGNCLSCDIVAGKIPTFVARIAETRRFVVEQDFANPIPGFMIIATKRHICSIAEFDASEEQEYLHLLRKTIEAMKVNDLCKKITIIQEESASHFHLWLFPWYDWMFSIGNGLLGIPAILKHSQNSSKDVLSFDKIKSYADKIREYLRCKL